MQWPSLWNGLIVLLTLPRPFKIIFGLLAVLLLAASSVLAPTVRADDTTDGNWSIDSSYTVTYLGREQDTGIDRYGVSASWGATFFGMAVDTMPLMPADKAMAILLDAFGKAYPDRRQGDIRPGDSFEFQVPAGTLVGVQWRQVQGGKEFRSFQGDRAVIYTDPSIPLEYRIVRAELSGPSGDKDQPLPYPRHLLAGEGAIRDGRSGLQARFPANWSEPRPSTSEGTEIVTVPTQRNHLDDLRQLVGNSDPTGESQSGLDVYWVHSNEFAQPVFQRGRRHQGQR